MLLRAMGLPFPRMTLQVRHVRQHCWVVAAMSNPHLPARKP